MKQKTYLTCCCFSNTTNDSLYSFDPDFQFHHNLFFVVALKIILNFFCCYWNLTAASRCVAASSMNLIQIVLWRVRCFCILFCFSANHEQKLKQNKKNNLIICSPVRRRFSFRLWLCDCVYHNSNHIFFDLFVVVSGKYNKLCAQPDISSALKCEMRKKSELKKKSNTTTITKREVKKNMVTLVIIHRNNRDQC